MRVRLYFDEDSASHWLVRELRARGVDVTTVVESGLAQKTDAEELERAAADCRALYSFNRGDFYRLHTLWLSTGRSHSGIILSRQQLSVGAQMRRLVRLINSLSAEEMRNRVEFLKVQPPVLAPQPQSRVPAPVSMAMAKLCPWLSSDPLNGRDNPLPTNPWRKSSLPGPLGRFLSIYWAAGSAHGLVMLLMQIAEE